MEKGEKEGGRGREIEMLIEEVRHRYMDKDREREGERRGKR